MSQEPLVSDSELILANPVGQLPAERGKKTIIISLAGE